MTDRSEPQDASLLGKYRETVLAYEAISEEIASLLEANGGGTVKMSDDDFMRYRDMARRRDMLYDMMKRLEVRLLGEDAN